MLGHVSLGTTHLIFGNAVNTCIGYVCIAASVACDLYLACMHHIKAAIALYMSIFVCMHGVMMWMCLKVQSMSKTYFLS